MADIKSKIISEISDVLDVCKDAWFAAEHNDYVDPAKARAFFNLCATYRRGTFELIRAMRPCEPPRLQVLEGGNKRSKRKRVPNSARLRIVGD